MQTSIEWLWEQMPFEFTSKRSAFEVLEQAKEMHKQEIINSVNSISVECEHYDNHKWNYENGEQYYQNTFKKD